MGNSTKSGKRKNPGYAVPRSRQSVFRQRCLLARILLSSLSQRHGERWMARHGTPLPHRTSTAAPTVVGVLCTQLFGGASLPSADPTRTIPSTRRMPLPSVIKPPEDRQSTVLAAALCDEQRVALPPYEYATTPLSALSPKIQRRFDAQPRRDTPFPPLHHQGILT